MSTPKISPKAIKRIWEDDGYRLFLSHKSEVSKQAGKLKKQLKVYGVSAFVAHTSIQPTREWQDEIESALYSMDALAALMTEDFTRAIGRTGDTYQLFRCDWGETPMGSSREFKHSPAIGTTRPKGSSNC